PTRIWVSWLRKGSRSCSSSSGCFLKKLFQSLWIIGNDAVQSHRDSRGPFARCIDGPSIDGHSRRLGFDNFFSAQRTEIRMPDGSTNSPGILGHIYEQCISEKRVREVWHFRVHQAHNFVVERAYDQFVCVRVVTEQVDEIIVYSGIIDGSVLDFNV